MPSHWMTLNEAFAAAQRSPGGCSETAFKRFLERGEMEAKAYLRRQLNPRVKIQVLKLRRPTPIDKQEHERIAAGFWLKATVDLSASSAVVKDRVGFAGVVAGEILVSRADVERLWPSAQPASEQPASEKTLSTNTGGAPTKWDWEGAIVEMGRIAHHEGLPKTQAAMVDKIQRWFMVETRKEPGLTGTKERVSRFYKAIWPKT